MKVLLTGHLGYIGTVLAPRLLERAHEVVGLDSDLFAECTFAGAIADIASIGQDVRSFVLEPDAIDRLRGFDAVIHLAGLSNDPLGDYRPGLTQEINTGASVDLARLAKAAGIPRFVYASSCSNYGASDDNFITEDGALNPVTPYGVSKVESEKGIVALADETFSPTFLRASTAYGLSPRLRFDLVVNNLTAWATTTGDVHLKSDGSPWRPIVHVEDIALAYIASVEAPREDVHCEVFNVGQTSENYQIREIAEIVRDIVPGSKIAFADDASPDLRNYRVDCNYIARRLHAFKPQWTCRRGVEQLFAAFTSSGLTVEQFEGPRFKRIAHIQQRIREGSLNEDLFPVRQFAVA
ncbi:MULTISPECIES: NAD-dependent epimerase/dehydratase family protein [Novosphingobium]|uniref:NAD-dependent epimerase/dehydratase family protein n=1 Tax=Novosphingobium TaxID=165696 RepID=UPI0006D577BC|nr:MULTISPECIES: SDR family oxidoreductase [Novosphingobium]